MACVYVCVRCRLIYSVVSPHNMFGAVHVHGFTLCPTKHLALQRKHKRETRTTWQGKGQSSSFSCIPRSLAATFSLCLGGSSERKNSTHMIAIIFLFGAMEGENKNANVQVISWQIIDHVCR